jgi:hypothetical protein
MKITKRQLKRIINEFHPRDVADAEYDEELETLGDVYSDMHKEYHGRRPKGPMFKTHEEAISAIKELSAALKSKYEAEDELVAQDLERQRHEEEIQSLMPGEYDIETPMRSGMKKRMEAKITKNRLQQIIKEELESILQAEEASEVEAIEGVWGGDPDGESRNLELPLDHSEAGGSEKITTHPETLDITGEDLKESKTIRVSKRQLKRLLKNL